MRALEARCRRALPASRSPPEAGLRAQPRASKDAPTDPAARLIDQRIRDLGGWRGAPLARMRALIREEVGGGAFKALVKAAVARNGPAALPGWVP